MNKPITPKIVVDEGRVWVFGYRDTLYVELRERVPGYFVAVIDGFFREDQLDLMERVLRRANREIKKRMRIQAVQP